MQYIRCIEVPVVIKHICVILDDRPEGKRERMTSGALRLENQLAVGQQVRLGWLGSFGAARLFGVFAVVVHSPTFAWRVGVAKLGVQCELKANKGKEASDRPLTPGTRHVPIAGILVNRREAFCLCVHQLSADIVCLLRGKVKLVGVVTKERLSGEELSLFVLSVGDVVTAEQVFSGHLRKLATSLVEVGIWSILTGADRSTERMGFVTENGLGFALRRHGVCIEVVALWWYEELLLRCGGEKVPATSLRSEPREVNRCSERQLKDFLSHWNYRCL